MSVSCTSQKYDNITIPYSFFTLLSIYINWSLFGRFKTKKDFRLLAYERWSYTRGSKYSDLTWKLWVSWKTGRLVATRGSTVFTFLHYANWESDDVMRFPTKMVKYWIKNISGNVEAVFFKLGTKHVHHNNAIISTTKKIFQKGTCHSSLIFRKAFQISSNYFSFLRYFKTSFTGNQGFHLEVQLSTLSFSWLNKALHYLELWC